MTPFRNPKSPLQALAAKWGALCQMLIAAARMVSMSHKQTSHGGARQAEMIEAQIYCALVSLSGIIATYPVNARRLRKADREALVYLKMVYGLLGVIALMIRQLRTELDAAAERFAVLSAAPVDRPMAIPTRWISRFEYLDPG